MFVEARPALGRGGHVRARLAVDKALFSSYVAGLLKCLQVGAEVAVGQVERLSQGAEINLHARWQRAEGGHDAQAGRRVDDKALFSSYVAGLLKCLQVGAEVAVGQVERLS